MNFQFLLLIVLESTLNINVIIIIALSLAKMDIYGKLIIAYILGLLGFLILTTYVIPTYAYGTCSYADQIPDDAVVNLNLNAWMLGNFISGLPLYSIVCGALEFDACRNCLMYFFMVLAALYTIFQNIWSIIGFLIFNSHYRDHCASAGLFNTYIDAGVYYGLILFPITTIVAIIFGMVAYFRNKNRNNEDNGILSQNIVDNDLIVDAPVSNNRNV